MRIIALTLILSSWFCTYGQQIHEISGYILDSETGAPVPFASVGVPAQGVGISTNVNGYFMLMIKEVDNGHVLEISSIGYAKKSIPFSEISWGQEQRFRLDPKVTVLEEVVVRGRPRTLEDVMLSASKKRKVFLRTSPYLTYGFYREVLRVNEEYQGLTEAQGIFYINGYNSKYKNNRNQVMTYDLAQWKHMRRSDYPEAGYLRIGKLLKAKDYYLHDGPLQKRNLQKFQYTVVDTSQYEDDAVLVVDFEPRDEFSQEFNYQGRMKIKEDDQALLSMEVEQLGKEPFLPERDAIKDQASSFTISFWLFEGEYYLNRSTFTQTYTTKEGPHEFSLEIIGGPFTQQKPEFLNTAQRAVLYSDMLNPMVNYDPDFWDSYKFAESDVFQKVEEQVEDLQQQFQDNDELRLMPLPEGMNNYEQMVNEQNILDFFMQY